MKPRDRIKKEQRKRFRALERSAFFVLSLDPPMAFDLTTIIVGYFMKAEKAEDDLFGENDLFGNKETWAGVVEQIMNSLNREGYSKNNDLTEKFWAYLRARAKGAYA
jgi:hypothetical protein